MKKWMLLLMIGLSLIGFSGCSTKKFVNGYISQGPTASSTKITVTLYYAARGFQNPPRATSAIYYAAKFAKDRGYNYIRIIAPKEFQNMMFNTSAELKQCLTKMTLNLFDPCVRVRQAKSRDGYAYSYALVAEAYKDQPADVLTIPVDEILRDFKEYDLEKDGYIVRVKEG